MQENRILLQGQFEFSYKDQLGSGAFANVYKGVNTKTGEILAIKKIDKQKVKKYGEDIIKAIGNEVNILQQISYSIDSPYIIKIYDCFQTENSIYMILEYCNEGTLGDILKKKKILPEEEAKSVMFQIVQAIDILAKNNIAHRDIKPDNVFIKDGIYKLGDFGFAAQKNLFGTTLGTYPYMAPEMFTSTDYDNKVDTWALGVMYHEMIFGQLYFTGMNQATVQKNVTSKPYIIPTNIAISQESKDFLTKALQKDPNKRLSAQDMVQHPLFASLRSQIKSSIQQSPTLYQAQQTPIQLSPQLQQSPTSLNLNANTNNSNNQQDFMQQGQKDVIQKILNYRNGVMMLVDLAEQATSGGAEQIAEIRFSIFMALKKAVVELIYLANCVQSKTFPSKIFPAQQQQQLSIWMQKWEFFKSLPQQSQADLASSLLKDLQTVKQNAFSDYLEQILIFIKKQFSDKELFLKTIINDSFSEFPEKMFSDMCRQSFKLFQDKVMQMQNGGAQGRRLLEIAFQFQLASDFGNIVKQNFNFETFMNSKPSLTEQQLKSFIQTGQYQIFFDSIRC